MPYLHDESQQVAHEYGARTTPDVFVLDAAGGSSIAARPTPTTRIRRCGRVAAGRARRRARRQPGRARADRAGRLLDQVAEPVTVPSSERVRRELALEHLARRVARQLVDEDDRRAGP